MIKAYLYTGIQRGTQSFIVCLLVQTLQMTDIFLILHSLKVIRYHLIILCVSIDGGGNLFFIMMGVEIELKCLSSAEEQTMLTILYYTILKYTILY